MDPQQIDRQRVDTLTESGDQISGSNDKLIILKPDDSLVLAPPRLLPFQSGGGVVAPGTPDPTGVALNTGAHARFQIPATANITVGSRANYFTATTLNTPVTYDVPRFEGDGVTNVMEASVVGNKGRITFKSKGNFSANIQLDFMIKGATIRAGSGGELVAHMDLYSKDGTKKNEFMAATEEFNDSITSQEAWTDGRAIGLTPVELDDYLEFRLDWIASHLSDVISVAIPAHSTTSPAHIDLSFYSNSPPVNVLGDLSFTPIARIDVEDKPAETDIADAPIAAYIQKSSSSNWEVGEHSHASTLDGNTWIRDMFGRQSNPGVFKITGTGKDASVDSSFTRGSVQNGSLLFSEKPYGIAASGTRIVMAGRNNATQVQLAFGTLTLTNSPTSTTADWGANLTLTLSTTADTLDIALTGNTLITLVEQSGTKKIFFSTLSGTGKDTTISATSAGQDVASWIDNIDAHGSHLVYFGADPDTQTAGDFQVGISTISGSGSTSSLGSITSTNVGVLNTTGWTEAPVAQGVAFNGETLLLSVSLRKPGYQAQQRLAQEYNRIYTWAGVIAGEAVERDLNTIAQVSSPTLAQVQAIGNRRPRWGAGNPVPGQSRTPNDRLNIWNFTGTTAITGEFGTAAGISGYPLTKIAFGTPGSLTGRAAADWGTPITLDHPVASAATTRNFANNSGFFAGNRYFKFSGSGKTATFDKSQAGIIPTGFVQGARNSTSYVLTDSNVLVELKVGGTQTASVLKVYNLTITDTSVVATTDYTINIPPNQTGVVNGVEYTDFKAQAVYVYNSEVYILMTSTTTSNVLFETQLAVFNIFSGSLTGRATGGFGLISNGITTPSLLGGQAIRAYRVRSFMEGTPAQRLAEVFINATARADDDIETIAGNDYLVSSFLIQTIPGVVVQAKYGIRADATAGGVVFLVGHIGQIPTNIYFTIDAVVGSGALPGSPDLVGFDIGDLDLATTITDTDQLAFYNPASKGEFAITMATIKGTLNQAIDGITTAEATTLFNSLTEDFAKKNNAALFPVAKMANAPSIRHISTGFTSVVGKRDDQIIGDTDNNNRLAFLKKYDSKTSLIRPDLLEDGTTGVDGDRGVLRPTDPQGFISLATTTGVIKLVIATSTSNTLDSDTATFRVRYRKFGQGSWNTYNLAKFSSGTNTTQTEYRFTGTIVPLDTGDLTELQISADAGANYLELHAGSYVNFLLDYDNFQRLMASIIADLRAHATGEAGKVDGDYIVSALKARTETQKLPYSALQGNPELQEVTTLPDLDDVEVGAVVVQKKGDNHLIKYVSPDTEITTPDRNKITITLSQQRIFWYGDGGTGVSVRNYNGFVGRYEVTIIGSIRYVRLYLRADMLAGLGISLSTQNTCFQAAVAVPGGTKTYLTYIRTASSERVAGHQYWEYWSSQGDPTGRPNAQGATYDIFFRNPANSANINIFPEKTLGKGWVSTDKNTDAIIAQIKAAIGNAKLPSTAITGPPIVPEFSSLPATAGYTGGEVIVLKTGNNRDFYTLTSQSQTVTNRDQIQVATGISVADGFDAGGNAINKIAYDADLPDDAEGGRAVRNYQMFIGYLQRQTISTGPNQYTMLLYLREDMLAGIGIDAGAPSASVRFKAAFTTASEAKTYLNFTRTPQTDYILGHQYLGFTSVASTPPSTTGYPESASTTYTISFQTSAGAPLNIWPQTIFVPDAWVAVPNDVASWAENSNTDRIPESKSRGVVMTQAAYNALVAADTDEDSVRYYIY